MSSKKELTKFITSNFNSELVSPDAFKIVIEFEEGRSQIVFAFLEDNAVLLRSPFAGTGDINSQQALSQATSGPFGLYVLGELYALANVSLYEGLDLGNLETTIMTLAVAADLLEEQMFDADEL